MNVVVGIIDFFEEIYLEIKLVKFLLIVKDDDEFIMLIFVVFIGRVCCILNVNVGLIVNKLKVLKYVEVLYFDICFVIF